MAKTIREELKDMYKAKGGQQGDLTNDSQTIAECFSLAGLELIPADEDEE